MTRTLRYWPSHDVGHLTVQDDGVLDKPPIQPSQSEPGDRGAI